MLLDGASKKKLATHPNLTSSPPMAADASIRVAIGRVALERRKARYPQTRHHGCFLRVIGARRAIAEALTS